MTERFKEETMAINGKKVKVIVPTRTRTLEEFERFLDPIVEEVAHRKMKEEKLKKAM